MKKLLTIFFIVLASSLSFIIQLVVNLFWVYPYIFPAVIFSAAAAFGTACFYRLFRGKTGLGAPLFWVVAFAPQLAFGIGALIWAVCVTSSHYVFIGPQGVVYFYDIPITAAAYAVFGGIFTAVQRIAEKKKSFDMKKVIAAALLIVIGIAALLFMVIGAALIGYVADVEIANGVGLMVQIAITLAGTFGIDRLRVLYGKNYVIKAPLFYLCTYAPIAVWVGYAVISSVSRGYSYSYYGNTITAMAFILAGTLLWLGVSALVKRVKIKSGSQSR